MIGARELLEFADPERLVNQRGVIQRDLVQLVDARDHFLGGGQVAIGRADQRQRAFEKQLFEQRLQRFGVELADIAVTDHQAQFVGGAGERGEIR